MKIVLGGVTGFIGSAVLQRCLTHPDISSIVTLSRRSPGIEHPKLHSIVYKDFHAYPSSLLGELAGAEACIWTIGTAFSGKDVHFGYTLAAANAFATNLVPQLDEGRRFRFVYVSGGLSIQDQNRSTFFLPESRRSRGLAETELVELEKAHPEQWQSINVRPATVTKVPPEWWVKYLFGDWRIQQDEIAAALVDLAVKGEAGHWVQNDELKQRGKALVEQS